LVADPIKGFHVFLTEDSNISLYYEDLKDLNMDIDSNVEPMGKIEKFSLSANRKLMAIYANPDRGTIIVLKSNLQ